MLRIFLTLMAALTFASPLAALDRAHIGTFGCELPSFTVRPPIVINKPITVECAFVSSQGERQLYEARINVQSPILVPIVNPQLKWAVHSGVPLAIAVLSGGYSSGLEDDPIAKGLGKELLIGGAGNLVVLQPGDPASTLISRILTMELEFLRCEPQGDAC